MSVTNVTDLASRRRSAAAAATTPAPDPSAVVLPAGPGAGSGKFTLIITTGGRREYLTEFGRAYRIGGRWFIGIPARLVTVPYTIAALDAAELRQP